VQQATGAKLYKGSLGNTMLLGGYDVIYDTLGTKRTLHDALRWTRAGGAVVIVGVSLHMMRIDLSPVWYQEVSLVGSMNHGTEQWPIGSQEHFSTFAISAELIAQGLFHPEKLITHRFALTNFPEALSTASGKEHTRAFKVIFDYALMPASVVPNVRSSAQLRRPVRLRTTATDAQGAQDQQEQQDQQPIELPAQQEPAPEERDWESMGLPALSGMYDISDMPTGGTWSQNVQPYPSPSLPAESTSEPAHEPEETIPQHLRALAGAVESPAHEYVEYEPAEAPAPSTASDDPLTMEFDLPASSPEEPANSATTPGEQPAMAYEQPLAMTEEPTMTFSRQREPQPILLPTPAQPASGLETELAEADQPDEPLPAPSTRTGRTRVKPSTRKTNGPSSATNQAPDTL
jgi:Zinc-binding dehydrogenase